MSKSARMAPSAMARMEGAAGRAGCSGRVRARVRRVRGRAKRMATPAALRSSWGVRFHPSGPGTPSGDPGFSALPRPMRRRRWAWMPLGEGRRKVSPRVALKSVVVSQGVAAVLIAALVVRRVGVAAFFGWSRCRRRRLPGGGWRGRRGTGGAGWWSLSYGNAAGPARTVRGFDGGGGMRAGLVFPTHDHEAVMNGAPG